jgi:hypothetical protein
MEEMMNRYNRCRSDGFNVPLVTVAVIIITLVVTYCVSYSEITRQYKVVSQEIKELESRDRELDRLLSNETARWAIKKSPGQLEMTLARHGLNLVWPRPKQIIRLYDTGVSSTVRSNVIERQEVVVRSTSRGSRGVL